MATRFLRSGPYEDTPLDEAPDTYIDGLMKALCSPNNFNAAEVKLIRDEYQRRHAEEDAARVAAAVAADPTKVKVEGTVPAAEPDPVDDADSPNTLSDAVARSSSRRSR